MGITGIQSGDHELSQTLVTLVQHAVMLEQIDVLQHHVRPVWDDFLPVRRLEVRNRCGYQAEVAASIVDPQIKMVAVMVDIVLDVGAALQHQPPAAMIIAESQEELKTMTVSMAVMDLDLTEQPAIVFRNAAHGGLSVVYRRADGNIGWIDPQRTKAFNGSGPKGRH